MPLIIYLNSVMLPPPVSQKTPEGLHARVLGAVMAFFFTVFILLRSVAFSVTKKLHIASSDKNKLHEFSFESIPKEEFRPPSEAELLSTVLGRLHELEEKVNILQEKPSKMPYEKEELLNAAVCRVDALEAELIATKKVKIYHMEESDHKKWWISSHSINPLVNL